MSYMNIQFVIVEGKAIRQCNTTELRARKVFCVFRLHWNVWCPVYCKPDPTYCSNPSSVTCIMGQRQSCGQTCNECKKCGQPFISWVIYIIKVVMSWRRAHNKCIRCNSVTHLQTLYSHHSIYRVHNMQVCTPKTNISAHITTCPIVPVNRKLVERRNTFLKRCSQMLKHSTSWVAGQEKSLKKCTYSLLYGCSLGSV